MSGGGPEAGCSASPAAPANSDTATATALATALAAPAGVRRPPLTSRRHIDLLRTSSAA